MATINRTAKISHSRGTQISLKSRESHKKHKTQRNPLEILPNQYNIFETILAVGALYLL